MKILILILASLESNFTGSYKKKSGYVHYHKVQHGYMDNGLKWVVR